MQEVILLTKGLFLNLAVLVGFVSAYGALRDFFKRGNQLMPDWMIGIPAALAAVATMLVGVELVHGLVMDSRVAPLAFSGLLGGPLGGFIALVSTVLLRVAMGGAGVLPGVAEIVAAIGVGLFFRWWLAKKSLDFTRAQAWRFALGVTLVPIGAATAMSPWMEENSAAMNQNSSMAIIIIPFMFFSTWLLGRFIIWDKERVTIVSRLDQTQSRFRMLLDQSQEAVWVWEINPPIALKQPIKTQIQELLSCSTLVESNRRAAEMMGFSSVEATLGKGVSEIVNSQGEKAKELIDGFFKSGAHFFESRPVLTNPNTGQPHHYLHQTQGVLKNGRLSLIWVTMRDITAMVEAENRMQKAEQRLEESQKMETIGTLASGVAHDFKNILAPILGQADLLAGHPGCGSEERAAVEIIRRAAARGIDLVKRMLTYGSRSQGDAEPLYMSSIIDDCLMMIGPNMPTRVTLMRQFDSGVPAVFADRARLEQVVLNLIQNATDVMKEKGGMLSLKVSKASEGRVEIKVSDQGSGMNEETARRVFEPFFTTKEKTKGTGLGLYVVHGIVLDLEGEIKIKTRAQGGCTVEVLLPGTEQLPRALKKESKMLQGQGESILFVDDDEDVRETLGGMLRRIGYQVTLRESVDTALQFLGGKEGVPDLVISDLGMPGRNGLDLAKEIKNRWPNLTLIILTGDGEVSKEDLAALGVALTLEKPIGLIELSETVAQLIKKT